MTHRSDENAVQGSSTEAEREAEVDAGTHASTHAGSDATQEESTGAGSEPARDTAEQTTREAAPETTIEESDPNADSSEGLAGEMGVSSERPGPVRGAEGDVTYGTAATFTDADDPEGEVLPEQAADDGTPEPNPDSPGAHESDPARNPGHGV